MTASPPVISRLRLTCAFVALYLIWGSTYLAIRIGVESWPPLLLASLRFLVAGSVLYAALRLTGTHAPTARQWRDAGVVGVLLLTVGNGAVSVAEKTVASGVAALAVATVPLFTAAFARLFGHRNTRWEWAGIVLGLLGMGLLNLGANLQASPQGAALLLLASVSWSFGSVWGKHLDLPSGGMASAVEMLVAGAVLAGVSPLLGEVLPAHIPATGWWALLYLVAFGSLMGFTAYVFLLKHTRPAAATSYAYVNPVVAVWLGVVFAGEQVGQVEIVAMGVILGAVVLIGLPQWWRRGRDVPAKTATTGGGR